MVISKDILFVTFVFFYFWAHSPNFSDAPGIQVIFYNSWSPESTEAVCALNDSINSAKIYSRMRDFYSSKVHYRSMENKYSTEEYFVESHDSDYGKDVKFVSF